MPEISRAFIVTDPMMVQLGNVDKILHYLRKRKTTAMRKFSPM